MTDEDEGKIDGRSLRKTGRTHQFATRIKEETHSTMKIIAARDGLSLAELLEKAVEAYERSKTTAGGLIAMWDAAALDEQRELLRHAKSQIKAQT